MCRVCSSKSDLSQLRTVLNSAASQILASSEKCWTRQLLKEDEITVLEMWRWYQSPEATAGRTLVSLQVVPQLANRGKPDIFLMVVELTERPDSWLGDDAHATDLHCIQRRALSGMVPREKRGGETPRLLRRPPAYSRICGGDPARLETWTYKTEQRRRRLRDGNCKVFL